VGEKIYIINSSKIEGNFLINSFITEFDNKYNVVKNIKSKKIDLTNKDWKVYDAKIFENNTSENKEVLNIKTNFDYKRIQTLYSSLSSFDLFELFELRNNYKKMNYSLVEIDLQLLKLISYPFYLLLMTIFSAVIMFRVKRLDSTTIKISLGLFFSVIIYYINNFFFVMGTTEKISILQAIFIPLSILAALNTFMLKNINEK
jgi:lipopolysaccharide export system permease protein